MIWDTHIHSNFSTDSSTPPKTQILSAISHNLAGICFTDHCDFDYPNAASSFLINFPHYFSKLEELQEQYSPQFPIRIGVEMGLQPHLASKIADTANSYPFDYIIGSTHIVNHQDPTDPVYFQQQTEKQGYRNYFEELYNNIQVCTDFDSLGHLDYVVRYGPTKDLHYVYNDYSNIIDAILEELIKRDKALEINTGGFRCSLSHPNPCESIITRYHQLGGELITIGSDAHIDKQVGLAFHQLPDLLARCGFHQYAVYTKRVPTLYPL